MTLKISKAWISDLFITVGIFSLFSVPSLKLVYFSNLVNLLPLLLLIFALIIKLSTNNAFVRLPLHVLWAVFSLFLLTSYLLSPSNIDETLFKYFYVILAVHLTIFLVTENVGQKVVLLMYGWATLLAVWQVFVGVELDSSRGHTYLTISTPLGAAVAGLLVTAFFADLSLASRLLLCSILVLLLLALGTLLSRAALLLPSIIMISYSVLYILTAKSIPLKARLMAFAVVLLIVGAAYQFTSLILNDRQLDRFLRLTKSTTEEPRVAVYARALDLFFDKPWEGYGIGTTPIFFNGYYPHNLFLEVLVSGGIILLLPILVLIIFWMMWVLKDVRRGVKSFTSLSLMAMSLYFFLQWNISYSLEAAYIPFGMVVLYIVTTNIKYIRLPQRSSGYKD